MNVLNKIALVTGGGTGIGKAASMELAKRGAIVAVNYSRSQSEAEETVEMIQKAGGQAFAIQADVSKNSDVQDMIQAIVSTHGTVDILVNNASITRHIPMDDLEAATEDVWDELYAVNVKGMFFLRESSGSVHEEKQGRGDRKRRQHRRDNWCRIIYALRSIKISGARFNEIIGPRLSA